jgi:hypothetical protein
VQGDAGARFEAPETISAQGRFEDVHRGGYDREQHLKFTDAPLAEGKFETYLHERENAKKPRAVRLSRPQLPMINWFCSPTRLIDPRWSETLTKSWG